MDQDKWHTRLQLFAGIVLALSGIWLITAEEGSPDLWLVLSVGTLVAAMIWSGFARVPSGLMFAFSVLAMVFAVIYWPVEQGARMQDQQADLADFYHSFWYFLVFLMFGYLFWFNRKRW